MTNAKRDLYECVDHLRSSMVYGYEPINIISLVNASNRIDLEYYSFNTMGLCGVAMVGDKKDTIVLNMKRSKIERNFDCGHELLHLYLHRTVSENFNCFATRTPKQNSFIEWQANEGAAQLLVPYQDFIPRFLCRFFNLGRALGLFDIIGELASYYGVTPQVIRNRIECLSYEMDQYQRGIDPQHLQLLSKNQRKKLNITPTNYLALCDFPLDWDSEIG